MSVYVKNGTPLDRPSLCETCSRAFIARGYRESEMIVVCQATDPDRQVDFRVRDCSRHTDKTGQTIYEMEKIAIVVDPKMSKREAGFLKPAAANEAEIELVLDKTE